MEILIINSKLYPEDKSGPQKACKELIQALSYLPDIKLSFMTEIPLNNDYKKLYKNIIFYFIPKPKIKTLSFFHYQWNYFKILKKLNKKFDVIHYLNFPGGKFLLSVLYARLLTKKLILTVYDWVPSELKYYSLKSKILHIIHWVLSLMILNKFDYFIVNSNFIKLKLRTITKKPIKILKIGFDKKEIEKLIKIQNHKNINNENYIFSFGSLNKKKGYEYLIRAFKLNENKITQKLIIAGTGPLKNELLNLIDKLNISHRINLVGYITEKEKMNLLMNASLTVHAAEYEGFGIAILESLFISNKVLVSDIGGQTDFKKNFSNLYFFKSKSSFDLSKKIISTINEKTQLIREINIEMYTNEQIVKSYITIYKQ